MTRGEVGNVLEFRFPEYLVYGVCVAEDSQSGDVVAMYAKKFVSPLASVDELLREPIRETIQFVVKAARARKNKDILRIVGRMDRAQLPVLDLRFRSDMSGIATQPCWHIIEEGRRISVPFLTRETALLSEFGFPNMDFIRTTYDKDLYPWSAELLRRGPLNFDPDAFEAEMRAKLGVR